MLAGGLVAKRSASISGGSVSPKHAQTLRLRLRQYHAQNVWDANGSGISPQPLLRASCVFSQ
jgi:hypothetical protein